MIHPLSFDYFNVATLKSMCKLLKLRLKPRKYIDITPDELLERMQTDEPLTIIDCRGDYAFSTIGHIENAKHHPIGTFDQTMHSIPKDQQVAVVCYFGYFCQIASDKLTKAGHNNVLSMKHGMEEWIDSGKPIQK